jgi:hypothetical protein
MDNNDIFALLGTTQCLIGLGCTVLNLIVVVACVLVAQNKNRSGLLWGVLGLFFSVVALFILFLLPTVQKWPVAYPPPASPVQPPMPYPPAPAPYGPYAAPSPPPAAVPYPVAPAATVIQGGWRLAVVQGVDAGQSFALGAQARLGRNPDNEVRLNDPQASRYHALVQRQQNNYVIMDQGSGNGTYVNGQLIRRPTALALGDVITIGNTQLKVS